MAVEVGAKVSGKVTGITNFGAFVDLGDGQTGLVHISEVSDAYVKDIHDVLQVGDTVTVKVMSMQDGKVGLSIRKADANAQPAAARPSRPASPSGGERPQRPFRGNARASRPGGFGKSAPRGDFDAMMSGFLKDSEDRLSSLRRNTEGKRGGRGGRRN